MASVRSRRFWTACLGAALFAGGAPARAERGDLLLDHVTVVDPANGTVSRDRAVLIHGDRIVRVGPAAPTIGAEVRRIDGAGRYLVPGFLDMHAHPLNSPTPQRALALMVAYGITGFRQMSGTAQLLDARRRGVLPLGEIAPALLATPGEVLAGALANDPVAAAGAVDAQKAAGADFIKVIDLRPPAFAAVAGRARADGLTFVGHLPPGIDVRSAMAQGMRGIEHLGPNDTLLLSCARDEAMIRGEMAAGPRPEVPLDRGPALARRITANPMLTLTPAALARMQRVLNGYDETKCRALAGEIAAHGLWQTPTLIRLKAMELADDPAFAAQPELRYAPTADRALWRELRDSFDATLSPAGRATLRALWARQLRLAKLFDDAGVPMLAGTDLGGQWLVPGVSLHQEFDLLAQAGISPLHVLRMATVNGARFLGREADLGAVAAGKQADLVLLAANPLNDIANLHRIVAVVRGGRYLDRPALDAIAQQAELP